MRFGRRHAITDLCFLVESVERSIEFYVGRLGFSLRRRAEGFVDFAGAGLTLAVWQAAHMS
jgi:catechol 2,3-dioxygenase-like lactoylglutathione lyase family enzyme